MHTRKREQRIHTKSKWSDDEVVVVRWVDDGRGSDDKDDEAMSLVPNQSIVLVYKVKYKFLREGKHVSIGISKYIRGEPLPKVMKNCTPEQMDHYKLQLSSIVSELATATSESYGAVRSGGSKSTTVPGHIPARNLIEKLRDSEYVNRSVPHDKSI